MEVMTPPPVALNTTVQSLTFNPETLQTKCFSSVPDPYFSFLNVT